MRGTDLFETKQPCLAAVIIVLQLVVLPHRAIGANTVVFIYDFFGFSLATVENARQLRLGVSWASWTDALLHVAWYVRNRHHFQINLPLGSSEKKRCWN
jgi:hypothetical protein